MLCSDSPADQTRHKGTWESRPSEPIQRKQPSRARGSDLDILAKTRVQYVKGREERRKGKKRTRRGKRGKIGGNKEPGERMKGRENDTSQETGVGWPGVSQHKNPGKWPAGADEARESLHRGPGEASAKDGRPQVLSWAGVQSAGQESRCWKLE